MSISNDDTASLPRSSDSLSKNKADVVQYVKDHLRVFDEDPTSIMIIRQVKSGAFSVVTATTEWLVDMQTTYFSDLQQTT